MHITKITFKNHPVFGNHEVNFGEKLTKFIFLVGENGAGKTNLIETIFHALGEKKSKFYEHEHEVIFELQLSLNEWQSLKSRYSPNEKYIYDSLKW